jgi:hypothetical protein
VSGGVAHCGDPVVGCQGGGGRGIVGLKV